MNRIYQILGVSLLLCLLSNCSTGGNLDSAAQRRTKIESSDVFKIEVAVYGYLLRKTFWAESQFSAIFLKGNDAEVDAVTRQFPNHVPPIKTSDRVQLSTGRSPIDKDTGKPAMLLAAIASEPAADQAEALGTTYAGPSVTTTYFFQLKKTLGSWAIASVHAGNR